MGPRDLASLLLARRRLASRLRWTSAELVAHRESALAALRAHAYASSVVVRSVGVIPRTALGKAPLVRTDPAALDATALAGSN